MLKSKSILFLSLMAALGNVAAITWRCGHDKPNQYCGDDFEGISCHAVPLTNNQKCPGGKPIHKCCSDQLKYIDVSRSQKNLSTFWLRADCFLYGSFDLSSLIQKGIGLVDCSEYNSQCEVPI
ncbi:hypothetical protein MJO28_006687 [Puccinia striiformis f. sp. tritici]|uniref:Uncharacterized protein n=1 Tax=Puccinia striiformis f. sp. tritici TaxID=168172 RepID=A0ACC0EIA2_9BASI|nr:hypothetical protein MJO28_006687 [Puccinia striiformis f. sp. tritici]